MIGDGNQREFYLKNNIFFPSFKSQVTFHIMRAFPIAVVDNFDPKSGFSKISGLDTSKGGASRKSHRRVSAFQKRDTRDIQKPIFPPCDLSAVKKIPDFGSTFLSRALLLKCARLSRALANESRGAKRAPLSVNRCEGDDAILTLCSTATTTTAAAATTLAAFSLSSVI